jgi:CheY-like chemotaxis protein
MVSRRKFHVLVVDNGEDMVLRTTAMLEQLGYTTEGETESLAGLRAFSQNPDKFDIAIVEPAMSAQRGPELAVLGSMRRGCTAFQAHKTRFSGCALYGIQRAGSGRRDKGCRVCRGHF